ncbi:hypothetical protein [Herbaspirillum robiniae]|uniref:Uncharacterized protein n=1 Tax=Herbaspirillum robiniae TaxID=2014887 RepID=A0A246WJU4_9BURK|nr:hypothetical protein [Herbaspirillum robiniae]OWY26481.1 hypothetical protein CEJ42_23795 [Herbaspirillum robiniae]
MSKNSNRTGPQIVRLASSTLRSTRASAADKSLAASALAQASSVKSTGKVMETKASSVLKDKTASKTSKSLAASLLSQSNRIP